MNNIIAGVKDDSNDLKFRMYSDDDMDGVREVISEYFPNNKIEYRVECFKYAARRNPYESEISPYCIAEENNQVVGYVGQMATRFLINGVERKGFYAHDILLKASQRGKGVGTRFIGYQKGVCKTLMAAFWANAVSHRAYQKAGWTHIAGLRAFSLHMRAEFFLSNRIKSKSFQTLFKNIINPLLSIRAQKWTKSRKDSLSIEDADIFDSTLDKFVEDASQGYGIIMLRRSAMLNWKFANRNDQDYKLLILREDEAIRGYAVLRIIKTKEILRLGRVVDFLVRKNDVDAFKSFIFYSLAWFYKQKVHHVSVLTSQKWLMEELQKFGFRRDNEDQAFMITNWNEMCADDFIKDLQNWYVTYCESDFGFWSAD